LGIVALEGYILRKPLISVSSSALTSFVHKVGQAVSTAKEKIKEKVRIKPTESAVVNINTTDDITSEQVYAL